MPDKPEFKTVFDELKSILKPYAKKMDVAQDTDTYYLLNTRHIMKNKQPLCFGGVRLGKSYVSFYLMTVYASPDLLKAIPSPFFVLGRSRLIQWVTASPSSVLARKIR